MQLVLLVETVDFCIWQRNYLLILYTEFRIVFKSKIPNRARDVDYSVDTILIIDSAAGLSNPALPAKFY